MLLSIIDTHWMNDIDPKYDHCLHGSIQINIDNKPIIFKNNNFTLSVTGLYLLRMLKFNYLGNHEWGNYFLPCCGFTYFPCDDEQKIRNGFYVDIPGCATGLNITIMHLNQNVEICFEDKKENISLEYFQNIVTLFTNKIENEYSSSKKETIKDKYEEKGYQLFWKEWRERKKELLGELKHISI
jgi:hypothetical protein